MAALRMASAKVAAALKAGMTTEKEKSAGTAYPVLNDPNARAAWRAWLRASSPWPRAQR